MTWHQKTKKGLPELIKVAKAQGYPDKTFEYARKDPHGYMAKIKEDADTAKAMRGVTGELNLMKFQLQELMNSYLDKNNPHYQQFRVRVFLDGKYDYVDADDLEKTKTMMALSKTVGDLNAHQRKIDLTLSIDINQFKIYLAQQMELVKGLLSLKSDLMMSIDNIVTDEEQKRMIASILLGHSEDKTAEYVSSTAKNANDLFAGHKMWGNQTGG